MDRIKEKHLEYLVEQINKITGNNPVPYSKNGDGKFHANIGNYNLSYQYGGVALEQILNEGGGVHVVINRGTKEGSLQSNESVHFWITNKGGITP